MSAGPCARLPVSGRGGARAGGQRRRGGAPAESAPGSPAPGAVGRCCLGGRQRVARSRPVPEGGEEGAGEQGGPSGDGGASPQRGVGGDEEFVGSDSPSTAESAPRFGRCGVAVEVH